MATLVTIRAMCHEGRLLFIQVILEDLNLIHYFIDFYEGEIIARISQTLWRLFPPISQKHYNIAIYPGCVNKLLCLL